jgi:glycosyltransferase involved in cell wall biosynthesis
MRILYLADIRFPLERANGIQSIETCHALAARGHDVTLIVRPDSHEPARDPFEFYGLPRLSNLHVDVAPVTGPIAARRAGYLTFALGRAIGHARQDLIFTRDLGLASLVLRLPRALRAPLVYEAHTIAADAAAARPQMIANAPAASEAKLRRLTARDQRVWRGADGYVTITDGLRRELETRFGPRERTAVVPDGVRAVDRTDRSATENTEQPAADQFVIGYAGHLYPWKGVDIVVEAVAALTDTRGLIVGGHDKEPDLERVKAFAKELSCESRITFTGLLPPPAVRAKLAEADVLLLPNPKSAISNAFTSPLKLFEYMAAERPIVASDLPSIREVLRDDENALLVEPGNPQAFVNAITRLKKDATLAKRLAARARADVAQFTWRARAERLETLFASLAGART